MSCDMYYRNFEGLDEVRRGSFVELSGRLLQKNRSDSRVVSGHSSDRYVKKYMSAGVTEPIEVGDDVKRISFVSKANEIFQRSSVPKNTRSEPTIQKLPSMEKQRKISTQTSGAWPPKYHQPEGVPQFEEADPQHAAKREAELESAVKILSMKLDYTQRKIVESQNNKEMLKARLDQIINSLTKAGYDPNLKAGNRPKSGPNDGRRSPTSNLRSAKYNTGVPVKADHYMEPSVYGSGYAPVYAPGNHPMYGAGGPPMYGSGGPAMYGPSNPPTYGPSNLPMYGPSNPPMYGPGNAQMYATGNALLQDPSYSGQLQTFNPGHISNASWEKLRDLAEEYERRVILIKNLEEQEKYVKSQMTTPVNITVPSIMGAPRPPNM